MNLIRLSKFPSHFRLMSSLKLPQSGDVKVYKIKPKAVLYRKKHSQKKE